MATTRTTVTKTKRNTNGSATTTEQTVISNGERPLPVVTLDQVARQSLPPQPSRPGKASGA